ncbi:MAG: hypothetical protein ACJ76H_03795 [Bacteriovoracaceae bacterium]
MKFIAFTMVLASLSLGAFAAESRKPASEYVVKGSAAQKLFDQLTKAQPKGWEGDCGMGKCWVGGEVRCESKIGTNTRNTPTTCTIIPLNQ